LWGGGGSGEILANIKIKITCEKLKAFQFLHTTRKDAREDDERAGLRENEMRREEDRAEFVVPYLLRTKERK